MKASVKQYGLALDFASEEIRGKRYIVMTAVNQVGWALQFAS